MKKTLSIFLCLIIVVSLFGCNVQNEDNLDNKGSNTATNEILNNTSNSTEKTSNEIYNEPFPDKKVIDIHSLEELNKMREMLLCEDEDQLKEYLSSFGNATTNIKPTKEDIEMFVSLADRFSFVNIVDGELIWMHYSDGISIDTGKRVEVFYITLEAENGNWIRYEYLLSVKDPYTDITTDSQFFEKPLTGTNETITLLSEKREPEPFGVGEIVIWIADIDGTSAFIFQYSVAKDQIKADDIINGDLIKVDDIK